MAASGRARDLSGRVAMVTGAGRGIGMVCAVALADAGARVAAFDLTAETAEATAKACGEGSIGLGGDVARSDDLDAAVERIERELGRLDILVCCAGIGGTSLSTTEVTDDEWRRVLAVNCDGVFYSNRAVIPGMVKRGYGRIVNMASIAGKEGNPQMAAYSTSKAAVIGMTKSIGKDLAGTGVLVNSIAPAVIRTPLLDQLTPENVDYMIQKIPMGRVGQPEEVAELVLYLASEQVSFATGACFDISGGRATY